MKKLRRSRPMRLKNSTVERKDLRGGEEIRKTAGTRRAAVKDDKGTHLLPFVKKKCRKKKKNSHGKLTAKDRWSWGEKKKMGELVTLHNVNLNKKVKGVQLDPPKKNGSGSVKIHELKTAKKENPETG